MAKMNQLNTISNCPACSVLSPLDLRDGLYEATVSKEIKLTRGKSTIVDDKLFDELNKYKWTTAKCKDTYYAIRASSRKPKRKSILMHVQIMGTPKGMETDHVNHNGLDNRIENLRVCSNTQNKHNRLIYSNNKSGYKGVTWFKPVKKWRASIVVNKKQIVLGYFANIEDAARAYDEAAIENFGEFASTNFPQRNT